MHWLSFLIGVVVGLLIGWLIDYLICRPRRAAAEADLRVRLEGSAKDAASLQAQLAGMKDLQARFDGANSQVAGLQAQVAGMKDLQADLDACRAQAAQHRLEIQRLNADLAAARVSAGGVGAPAETREVGVDASVTRAPGTGIAVTAPAPQPVEPDDLAIVEGIGPKISALLNQNGIYTFAQLAVTSAERLRSILTSGGPRFRMADPQTWPEQALLARDGKWDALQALQASLRGGRQV